MSVDRDRRARASHLFLLVVGLGLVGAVAWANCMFPSRHAMTLLVITVLTLLLDGTRQVREADHGDARHKQKAARELIVVLGLGGAALLFALILPAAAIPIGAGVAVLVLLRAVACAFRPRR